MKKRRTFRKTLIHLQLIRKIFLPCITNDDCVYMQKYILYILFLN